MLFERAVTYFMPLAMRRDANHPRYHEFRVVISACLIGLPLVLMFPIALHYIGRDIIGYLINGTLLLVILLCCKFFGHYRIPMTITALVTYVIIYGWIRDSGQIYSSNVSILHMYLLGAIWADKRYGWWAIFTNLGFFVYLYYHTLEEGLDPVFGHVLGGPLYALVMNSLITIFFGGFLAYLQFDQERDRLKIRKLQQQKISTLDQVVRKRTEQLSTMRENIATDFHDETGNMLSAITRQATMLKQKLSNQQQVQPIVDGIISNSNALYAISKDFLWHLNHDSDDPYELFCYLTEYGQLYYNQFDIAFSSQCVKHRPIQLAPSAALNLIYIFKEAMTNVVKHAGAKEVVFTMECHQDMLAYSLRDDGGWKAADSKVRHYGLDNMSKRCVKNGFRLNIKKQHTYTEINVEIPIDQHSQLQIP